LDVAHGEINAFPNHNTQCGPGGRVDVSLVPTKRVEPAIGKTRAGEAKTGDMVELDN
jgi:hypothetical protein